MATAYEDVLKLASELEVRDIKKLQAALPDILARKETVSDSERAYAKPSYGQERYVPPQTGQAPGGSERIIEKIPSADLLKGLDPSQPISDNIKELPER
ncbi:hypothetical protein [Luteibacter sp. CQ10]|uniref:hypothetical protein n=1 Tax=Luteibacter sp. CQ10 TaxID=2805821 RepID=UPI0034A4CA84